MAKICFSQIPFLEVNLKDIESNWSIQNAYLVKDKAVNAYYSILEESNATYSFKFDSTKTLVERLISKGLKRKYKEIIGYVVKDNI